MAKIVTFKGSQISFPPACVHCQQPAQARYDVTRTFAYGNRSVTVTLGMPLCAAHHETAVRKNPTEKLIGQIGLALGAVGGIAAALGLISYWSSSGQGSGILNIALAAILGVGVFLILWMLLAFFVAPRFGDPEAKAIRSAMRIRHYWPAAQDIQLEFANDAAAAAVVAANPGRVLKQE
jgi:hypothetical protein